MIPDPVRELIVDELAVRVYASNQQLGQAAAVEASAVLRGAVEEKGWASIILATGNSQLTFLAALGEDASIPWEKVHIFHMDEYAGIDPAHPASFPGFLRRHLIDRIHPAAFYAIPSQVTDLEQLCQDYTALLRAHPADVCACGYGENGHLAFNDPPYADFDDPKWVKVVALAPESRRQQVGEGHFASLEQVPTHAVTLTIPALLAAKRVLCIVPEARKAAAVQQALLGPVSEDCPGSILRRTPHATLFLDADSAGRLPHS
jgi:glucosamine-6-phosphate deaminase